MFSIITSYNFGGKETTVSLFKTKKEALAYLRERYEEKLRIANKYGWKTEYEISGDGTYAKIINYFLSRKDMDEELDKEDVIEFRLGIIYDRI